MIAPINFDELISGILFKWYEKFASDQIDRYLSYNNAVSLVSELSGLGKNLSGELLDRMIAARVIAYSSGGASLVISQVGVDLANKIIADKGLSSSGIGEQRADIVPSEPSSDEWSPLPIERNAAEYQTAVEASEAALQVIKGDNGFASMPERNEIVQTIEAGLEDLKNSTPSKYRLLTSLARPFRYVAEKFFGTLIGEAAKKGFDALMTLIASLS